MQNIIFALFTSAFTVVLGFLAYHASLHPPQTARKRTLLKLMFALLSLGTIAISVVQAYRNHVDQQNSDDKIAAYSRAVDSDYREMRQLLAIKCMSQGAFDKLPERCASQVLAGLTKFGRSQSQLVATLKQPAIAPINVERPANSPEVHVEQPDSTQKPNIQPPKEPFPAETRVSEYQQPGMVIRYGDGPKCFDIRSFLVYEGCADSYCKDACITLPLEDAPRISDLDKKPK